MDAVRVFGFHVFLFFLITSAALFCILAAGCGVCKRMQPIFQQAATETKGKYVSLHKVSSCSWGPASHGCCCLWSAFAGIRWDLSVSNVWMVELAFCKSTVYQPNQKKLFLLISPLTRRRCKQFLCQRFWFSRIIKTQVVFIVLLDAWIQAPLLCNVCFGLLWHTRYYRRSVQDYLFIPFFSRVTFFMVILHSDLYNRAIAEMIQNTSLIRRKKKVH